MKTRALQVMTAAALAVVLSSIGCSSAGDDREVTTIISLPDSSGVSVFELLDALHQVDYRETSSGIFVTGIDGISNSSSSYWIYFVNDSAGTVASNMHILQGGEKVEWRFVSAH